MGDGWLRNPKDGWTYRFQRDEKSWGRDPFVFVDKGRAMPDGSPALLKTRKHLRREKAEVMWKDLVRKGWEKVPAVWGVDAEPCGGASPSRRGSGHVKSIRGKSFRS